jgi:uncharacterized protein YdaU (DUF1376 family)
MIYYAQYIADYRSATAHLEPLEDLAYRRLLDLYYGSEKPIPNETQMVSRLIRMGSHSDEIESVLREFFVLDESLNVWRREQCDIAIAAYQAKADRNREVGKLGGRPKKTQMVISDNPDGFQTEPTTNPNQNQNHIKPKSKAKAPAAPLPVIELPADIPVETWEQYIAMRKAIKKPMTASAVNLGIAKLLTLKAEGQNIKAVLEQSIFNSWQGLLPVKEQPVACRKRTPPADNFSAVDYGKSGAL